MKIRDDESGQTLIFTALIMTVLVGFAALGLDVGMLFHQKRNMQIVADAAASAAAVNYMRHGSVTQAQTAGQAAATQNGVTNGTNGAVVSVNNPPSTGPNTACAGCFEAIVTYPTHTFFMGAFGAMFNRGAALTSVTVAARAVGATIGNPTCLYLTASSGQALYLQGSATINASGCGIYVNSPSNNALGTNGNASTINAAYVDVVGGSTSRHLPSGTQPTFNASVQSNPLGNISSPSCTTGTGGNTSTVTTLTGTVGSPGTNTATCYSNAVTLSGTVNLTGPGVFVFQGGLTIPSGTTLNVNGGTLDIAGGAFNQASNTNLVLTASKDSTGTDDYNGIAFMVPTSNSYYDYATTGNQLQVQFGSSTSSLNGAIYAPTAQLYLQDNGGSVSISCNATSSSNQQICTSIIVGSIYDKSSTLNIANYNSANPGTTPLKVVTLIE